MSIESLADHELRSLVRYGSHRFADLAEAELKRRAAAKPDERTVAATKHGPAAAAFPSGRWS